MPLSKDSNKYKSMIKGLGLMVAVDLQPYSVVRDKGFKFFCNSAEPAFTLPSRTTLSRTVIPLMYDEEVTKLKL